MTQALLDDAVLTRVVGEHADAPAWGEQFDIAGRAMSGPAARNMDRVRVVVRPSHVSVDATVVTKGARPTVEARRQANVDWFAAHERPRPVDYCSPTVPN